MRNLSFRNGPPFNVYASSDTSGTGENTTRGDQIGAAYQGVSQSLSNHQPVQWINPDAFANPAERQLRQYWAERTAESRLTAMLTSPF